MRLSAVSLYHRSGRGKRVRRWNRAHFSAIKAASRQPEIIPMLAPTPASPESAGMSKAALDRLENHLKQRYLDAGRFPGTQLLIYRRGKIVHSTVQGFADVERKVAGQGRHDLPHLFDDQADHVGRLHDAGRGRPRRARRTRPQIHSGMEEPRRVPGRHLPGLPDPAADAADADRGPAAAHVRPDLRLPAAFQCRRRLSREQDRRGRSRPARCKP